MLPAVRSFKDLSANSLLEETIYGKVIKYRDEHHSRFVAVKFNNMRMYDSTKYSENPKQEVRFLYRLHNTTKNVERHWQLGRQYIIQPLLSGTWQVWNYLVMEYCEGGELFSQVEAKTVSLQASRKYFTQLALALAYTHSHGICHMDISLENILLDGEDNIRLVDFGLAVEGTPESRHRGMRGKFHYMAPEVFSGRVSYDGYQADSWSLGILLWILITGSPLYHLPHMQDSNFNLIMRSGKTGMERVLKAWDVSLSEELMDLLYHLLRPAGRRLSMKEVLQHPWVQPALTKIMSQAPSTTESSRASPQPGAQSGTDTININEDKNSVQAASCPESNQAEQENQRLQRVADATPGSQETAPSTPTKSVVADIPTKNRHQAEEATPKRPGQLAHSTTRTVEATNSALIPPIKRLRAMMPRTMTKDDLEAPKKEGTVS
jgi:serine/threonine protein kinase